MRTRAQVNAWQELTAQHRRQVAAFAAEIAAAGRQQGVGNPTASVTTSKQPSAVKNNARKVSEVAFITPEKRTRKRKRPALSPNADGSKKQHVERDDSISPPARGDQVRTPPRLRPTVTIRRTLRYNAPEKADPAAEQVPLSPPAEDPVVEIAAATANVVTCPLSVLQRVANGNKSDLGDGVAIPIVGRAEERQQIESVFSPTSPTRALFVIGPPGTGKSSSVACVAHAFTHNSVVVRVNCSTFASPSALFEGINEQLWRRTAKHRLPAFDDAQAMDDFLHQCVVHETTATTTQHVLVLDEVDHLVRLPAVVKTKVQSLLRFFVRWAHLPNATLRFIGILNGIDMHAQIAEFLAHDPNPTSVVLFPSYSHQELVAILTNFVRSTSPALEAKHIAEAVEPRAVELIARKIGARDGDARRAVSLLQQCARACVAAVADETTKSAPPRLTIRDVLQLTTAAISSQLTVVKQIQQLPRQPKLLLYAITRLAPSETATTSLDDVSEELHDLQARRELAWIPRFRQEEMQQHLGSLECYALVKQQPTGKSKWKTRLASSVDMDTLRRAFQDDELLKELP